MKQKLLFILSATLFSVSTIQAQFIVKDETFSTTGMSDQGLIAGYAMQGGTYYIWNPDSATTEDIGGVAPGLGVGGQARFSQNGAFISGTSLGVDGPEMSRYEVATGQWTQLGYLGFQIDGTVSGGFTISNDGNTVAGNSWADTAGGNAYTHAVAWNQLEGLIDLGSLFADSGKSTRANAIRADGSVIVGWQDFNGPWKSAVWRKNPAGGYFPNEYLLIDEAGNPADEYNQLGECSAISADGTWIGGYGDYANNYQPWIWSADSGVINLGTLPNVGNGYVSSMSADASVVVGWFGGMLWGDPLTPFIWTAEEGIQEFNAYINTVLGFTTGDNMVYTADLISPNGTYVAGYGVNTLSFTYFSYRVNLVPSTGINEAAANAVDIFPNPTTDFITVETSGKATLSVSTADGRLVYKTQMDRKQVLDISDYSAGVYLLSILSENNIKTGKFIKN